MSTNGGHTIGDGDRGKARAISEHIISNARHAVGEGDGVKARATPESTPANTRYAIGNDQVCDFCIFVFIEMVSIIKRV